jgi:hypothetical protein
MALLSEDELTTLLRVLKRLSEKSRSPSVRRVAKSLFLLLVNDKYS